MTARRVPKVKNEDGVDGTPANAITKALLSAVENDDSEISCKALLNVFQSSSPSKSQILETIQFFPKSSAKRFFSGLKAILESIISEEAYVPDSAFEEENEDQEDDEEITPDEKSTECLHFLKYAALSVKAHVEGRLEQKKNQAKSQDERRQSVLMKQQLPILPQVHEVAFDLHNILLSLHSCGPESLGTLQAILSLCESWWFANAAHRDTLIAQCLPILVIQALDGKEFLKSHIQKLYKLRDAFHVIDFDNPSSDSLRQLLLRVASNPLCLKISEGKKFLASLFQDRDLVVDLHLAFRAQMPEAKSSVLQAYGEIYHRAWKHAAEAEESVQLEEEESVRDYLEHQTLQDLMHAVIHVASPTTHKSILTLLEPIHADKKSPEVASLLYRLYSPILWRSLAAANPIVRKNSIVVLEKVFPLQDGEVKVAVEKATGALKNALEDVDPRVRVAGSEATARICAMFWDALPSADIRMLLNRKYRDLSSRFHYELLDSYTLLDIVMEHSSDAASSAVRAAALEATITLLDAPQSHAVLRALLPSLGNLIHDKAERVRIAAVKMLNRIKQIKGIRFYHVVPVDHLTARLSEERRLHCSPRNAVAKELTALLLNSYFPSSSVNSQLQRTLAFLMTDPNAALVFYANLADHLEVESVVKFIVMLLACLKSAVQVDQAQEVKEYSKKGNKKRRRKGAPPPDQDDDEDSSEENNENNLSASNTPLMASLTETIQILWESIESQLSDPRYEACNALILNRFTKEVNLVHILSHFEQKAVDNDTKSRVECQRVCAAILCCASRLPKKAVKGIVSFVSSSLHSLAQEDRRPCPNVASHLALLCVCGMTEEVASTLAASIESAFGDDITLMSPVFDEGRRRSRRVSSGSGKAQSSVLPKFPLKMAWEILDNTLQGSNPSSVAVREAILSSPAAYSSMESALERGTLFAERLLAADSVRICFAIQHPLIT